MFGESRSSLSFMAVGDMKSMDRRENLAEVFEEFAVLG